MKDNTNQIKKEMKKIINLSNDWLKWVTKYNACAYTDRMLEQIISKVKTIETLHEDQFKD